MLQSITVMTYLLLVVATVLRSGMVGMVVSVVDSEALPLEVICAIIPRLVLACSSATMGNRRRDFDQER